MEVVDLISQHRLSSFTNGMPTEADLRILEQENSSLAIELKDAITQPQEQKRYLKLFETETSTTRHIVYADNRGIHEQEIEKKNYYDEFETPYSETKSKRIEILMELKELRADVKDIDVKIANEYKKPYRDFKFIKEI
jgi:hypothetical protein